MSQAARRSLSVLLGVLLLCGALAVASPAFAGKRASKKCHAGGWRDYQTTSGETFINQRACVKYVNKGGTLVTPPPPPTGGLTLTSLGLSAPDDAICPHTTYPGGCFMLKLGGFGLDPDEKGVLWLGRGGETQAVAQQFRNNDDGTPHNDPLYLLCEGGHEAPAYATNILASGEPIMSNVITELPC